MFQKPLVISLSFFICCSASEDFQYNGNAIPDHCLESFFNGCLFNEDELDLPNCFAEQSEDYPASTFEWEDVGMLFGNNHVIWMYRWEHDAMGKFSGILLIKREGEKLKLLDVVAMGDRHSSLITSCKIENDQIHYTQNATQESLFYQITKSIPELEPHCIQAGLCSGEAGFVGRFKYIATITEEGIVTKTECLHFEFAK